MWQLSAVAAIATTLLAAVVWRHRHRATHPAVGAPPALPGTIGRLTAVFVLTVVAAGIALTTAILDARNPEEPVAWLFALPALGCIAGWCGALMLPTLSNVPPSPWLLTAQVLLALLTFGVASCYGLILSLQHGPH